MEAIIPPQISPSTGQLAHTSRSKSLVEVRHPMSQGSINETGETAAETLTQSEPFGSRGLPARRQLMRTRQPFRTRL